MGSGGKHWLESDLLLGSQWCPYWGQCRWWQCLLKLPYYIYQTTCRLFCHHIFPCKHLPSQIHTYTLTFMSTTMQRSTNDNLFMRSVNNKPQQILLRFLVDTGYWGLTGPHLACKFIINQPFTTVSHTNANRKRLSKKLEFKPIRFLPLNHWTELLMNHLGFNHIITKRQTVQPRRKYLI